MFVKTVEDFQQGDYTKSFHCVTTWQRESGGAQYSATPELERLPQYMRSGNKCLSGIYHFFNVVKEQFQM